MLIQQLPILPSLSIFDTNYKRKWQPEFKPVCRILGAKQIFSKYLFIFIEIPYIHTQPTVRRAIGG